MDFSKSITQFNTTLCYNYALNSLIKGIFMSYETTFKVLTILDSENKDILNEFDCPISQKMLNQYFDNDNRKVKNANFIFNLLESKENCSYTHLYDIENEWKTLTTLHPDFKDLTFCIQVMDDYDGYQYSKAYFRNGKMIVDYPKIVTTWTEQEDILKQLQ